MPPRDWLQLVFPPAKYQLPRTPQVMLLGYLLRKRQPMSGALLPSLQVRKKIKFAKEVNK